MTREEITDGRNLRSIATKKRLLEASKELFYENGFEKTTITQIIKRAGTGYGTAYVYFKGKDEILTSLIEDVMQEFLDMANTPFAPATKQEAKTLIHKQVLLFLNMANENHQIMKVFSEAIGLSSTVDSKWNEIRETNIHYITRDITYSQSQGLARTDLQANLVARFWFFANENYQWEVVHKKNTASIEEIAKTLTDMYVDGLYIM
ncbi:TetR/AcrR family transcriptional regulator [Mammaliicoccus sciuri]|uniref:TetR family transcriptional regulator n=1 Tax=Sporosarcina newyorkensis 2681 TaxID=1027292 RepID=F9DTF9_9BACL|nr:MULTISPECIES: TetR/AcrR family transcriptional regulator [Sporosarcina]EGQ25717.1 TetR family transcriptional regulator [Sporosarcina newyorkensis 2681]MBY0224077.1 TetR/AcrR family transcriptional regulator [Sporosarcina aquimarina]